MALGFDQFLHQACPPLDLVWRKYRRRSARHRVLARMEELGLPDYRAYLERLQSDPQEAKGLPDRMRVTVSRFFRDRECWELLAERVLPALFDRLPEEATLNAWSAGCCGGEEPYSLALLWLERLAPKFPNGRIDILATDIDEASLDRARQGRYRPGSLRELPEGIRTCRFRRQGDWRVIDPEVRKMVQLRFHNLLSDPPPQGIDLVLARYLPFTYFRGERRRAAAERLWQALKPGGALMIGHREKLGPGELELFEPWPQAPAFYRRRGRTD